MTVFLRRFEDHSSSQRSGTRLGVDIPYFREAFAVLEGDYVALHRSDGPTASF